MAKTSMVIQQALSFSPLLLRIPERESVFWPGCALMKLDPVILEKTMEVLRREEPGIALAAGCCGQPTKFLVPEQWDSRREQLSALLQKKGVRRIYTACPNCTIQMGELPGIEIIPIWAPLARNLRKEDLSQFPGRFVWHAPCPIRNNDAQLDALGQLRELASCDCTDPGIIRCCGNIHMLRSTNPAQSAAIRRRRLVELEEDRTILSCCEGCLDAFRTEGRDTCHLLELLFGKSKTRGWGNRFRNTKKAPI